jgi:hypothetical protein
MPKLPRFLKPPKLTSGIPDLRDSFASIDGSAEEEARRHNEVAIAEANLELSREALQKNLNLVFFSIVVSTLAVVVAIAAVVVAIVKD